MRVSSPNRWHERLPAPRLASTTTACFEVSHFPAESLTSEGVNRTIFTPVHVSTKDWGSYRGSKQQVLQALGLKLFQNVGGTLGFSFRLQRPHEMSERPERGIGGNSKLWKNPPTTH